MNIRFLKTVVWLAHYKNFRITGERLHLTQPAISSRIQQVEQELGFRIFERQGREVSLTPAGQIFVTDAQEIVHQYDAMVNRHRPSQALGGVVKIGLATSMAHLLLPGIIDQLREQHPQVRLEILTADTNVKLDLLASDQLDICLMANHFETTMQLQTQPLCSLSMVWVASPALVSLSSYSYSAAELSMLPIISYAPGTLNAARTHAFFGVHQNNIRQLTISNSLGTSIQMAVKGIGAAVLPTALVKSELALGQLVAIRTDPQFPDTDYVAIWPRSSNHPAAQAVASMALSEARQLMQQLSSDLVRVS